METRNCSVRTTRVRWPDLGCLCFALTLALALAITASAAPPPPAAAAAAQTVEPLARAYAKGPTQAGRAELVAFAQRHAKDADGALALLAVAHSDIEAKREAEAVAELKGLETRLPKIADYIAYLTAQALYQSRQDAAAAQAASRALAAATVKSPISNDAAMLAARALLRLEKPKDALEILKRSYADLSQPAGDELLAEAFEASGDAASAANYYQRVYFQFPTSKEAADAAQGMARAHTRLGEAYPPALPSAAFARAQKLLDANSGRLARQEFEALVPRLGGADRELALTRIGAAMIQSGDWAAALKYLKGLKLSAGEADAERCSNIIVAARRAESATEITAALAELANRYPTSKWRLEGLSNAGFFYFLKGQIDQYAPLYERCAEDFPNEPQSALCHWRYSFARYLKNPKDAEELLRDHVRRYPGDENTAAALYFLARILEGRNDWSNARTLYEEVSHAYPNFYYAVLARRRLQEPRILAVSLPAANQAREFLNSIKFPTRRRVEDFTPTPATRTRLERSGLLFSAGLDVLAEGELRFGGRSDAQGHLIAMELAASAIRRGMPDQAIRWVKAMAPAYLMYPIDGAPRDFWRYAYPLPYRELLDKFSKERGLDPFLTAGLIRQESEFSAKVISRSHAYGLMQILPSTGRELGIRSGLGRISTPQLFIPSINIQLGTFYVKHLLDSFSNEWERTLASYNAGAGRVKQWLTGAPAFREPAEWVETIPFTETRGYVQTVIRNADFYRRLYANAPYESTPVTDKPAAPAAASAVAPAKPAAASSATKGKGKAATSTSAAARKRSPS